MLDGDPQEMEILGLLHEAVSCTRRKASLLTPA